MASLRFSSNRNLGAVSEHLEAKTQKKKKKEKCSKMGAISAASRLFFFSGSSNKLSNKFCISNISLQTNHQSAPLTPLAPATTLSKNKRESNTCLLISAPPGIGAVLLVQRANAVDLVAAATAAAAVVKGKKKK